MNLENPAQTKKHWLVLLSVSLMVGSAMGLLVNGNGVFYAPMARDLNVLRGSISLHGTFLSFAMAFASLTIPKLVERFGLKKILALGVGLGTLGTLLMGFTNNIYFIYLFGVIRGLGAAYYALVPMAMILNRWFEKKNGLAIGLASGSSGIVGAIAAPLFTSIIEASGWRFAFIIKSIFVLLLALPVLFYSFSLDPKDDDLLPYGHQRKAKRRDVIRRPELTTVSLTNITFIALLIIGFFNTFIVFMNSHFPGYGESVGLNPQTASFMLSGVMFGSLIAKIIFGLLSDSIGTVKAALIMIGTSITSLLMIIFLPYPYTLIAGSFLFGATFAIGGVALPILSNKFFGPVAGANVYSKANFLSSMGGAIGVSVTGYIFDFTGSYIPAFVIALLLNATNATLLILAKRNYNKNHESW